MIPKVILLGRSKIDWNNYLLASKQALGKKISKSLEDRGEVTESSISYLHTLAEMKDSRIDSNPANALDHIFYSFFVLSDKATIFELMEQTNLSVYTTPTQSGFQLSILSGTLDVWRAAIINGCSPLAGFLMRNLMDECLKYFEDEGLSILWKDFKKTKLPDNTIGLIEK